MFKPQKHVVYHDGDGNSDDLIAWIMLRLANNLEIIGTTVTNGDCYVLESYKAMRKIEHYLGLPVLQTGLWHSEMPNPFPDAWRARSRQYNKLSCLASSPGHARNSCKADKAVNLMRRCLTQTVRPVTVVCTGPLTVVSEVLQRQPHLAAKIRLLAIMGGALRVPGNCAQSGNQSAEWNVYCDPYSFKAVLAHDVPIRLISLDVTNKLPVAKSLLKQIAAQGKSSRASQVAAELWRLQQGYRIYLWDQAAVMSIIRPALFRFEYVDIDVVTQGARLGKLIELPPGLGRQVELATSVDRRRLMQCLLELLECDEPLSLY